MSPFCVSLEGSHGQGSGFHSMLELCALAGQAYLLQAQMWFVNKAAQGRFSP